MSTTTTDTTSSVLSLDWLLSLAAVKFRTGVSEMFSFKEDEKTEAFDEDIKWTVYFLNEDLEQFAERSTDSDGAYELFQLRRGCEGQHSVLREYLRDVLVGVINNEKVSSDGAAALSKTNSFSSIANIFPTVDGQLRQTQAKLAASIHNLFGLDRHFIESALRYDLTENFTFDLDNHTIDIRGMTEAQLPPVQADSDQTLEPVFDLLAEGVVNRIGRTFLAPSIANDLDYAASLVRGDKNWWVIFSPLAWFVIVTGIFLLASSLLAYLVGLYVYLRRRYRVWRGNKQLHRTLADLPTEKIKYLSGLNSQITYTPPKAAFATSERERQTLTKIVERLSKIDEHRDTATALQTVLTSLETNEPLLYSTEVPVLHRITRALRQNPELCPLATNLEKYIWFKPWWRKAGDKCSTKVS